MTPTSTILGRRGWPGNPERVWSGPEGPHPLPMFLVQVGWVLGPDSLLKHLRTVHQNSVFHCPTQGQVRGGGRTRPTGGGGEARKEFGLAQGQVTPDLLVPPPSPGCSSPEL